MLIRTTGDIIALSPPLIVEESHIDQAISTIADVLKTACLTSVAAATPFPPLPRATVWTDAGLPAAALVSCR